MTWFWQALKKNWDELHHQYQGLSVVTDTAPKKYRKERLEQEMKQLEKDIELIERHKTIYIANNWAWIQQISKNNIWNGQNCQCLCLSSLMVVQK